MTDTSHQLGQFLWNLLESAAFEAFYNHKNHWSFSFLKTESFAEVEWLPSLILFTAVHRLFFSYGIHVTAQAINLAFSPSLSKLRQMLDPEA